MGACGSKDVKTQQGQRDLSRWKVDNAKKIDADVDGPSPEDLTTDSESALNVVTAFPHSEAHCITGWEDGSLKQIDCFTKQVVTVWQPHSRSVNRIVVGDKTHMIYTCSRDTTIAAVPTIDTNEDKQPKIVLKGHSLNVSTIAVDAEESSLCSGGRDTQTILWDLQTQQIKCRNTTAQNVITCSKWIPQERVIAQGSEDLSVKLWDERTMFRAPIQMLRGYIYFPLSLDVSKDGNFILTSSKGFNGVGCEGRVWDRRTGKQLMQLEGHQQDATSCCFLPLDTDKDGDNNEKSIPTPITASKDGSIKIWDVTNNSVMCEAHEPLGRVLTSISVLRPNYTDGKSTIVASSFTGHINVFEYNSIEQTLEPVH